MTPTPTGEKCLADFVHTRDHDVTLFNGDVREVLSHMADGSVQCAVTSPPYYGLRDYGHDGQIGLEPSPAEYVEAMCAVFADVRRVLANDGVLWLNLGDSYAGSWGAQGKTEQGLHSKVIAARAAGGKDSRTGSITAGMPPAKNLMGMPWRVAFALQDDGWILRNAIVWAKPNAMPESVTDRLSTRYEHVFLFSKSRKYWFDLDAIREPHITADRPLFGVPNKGQRGWAVGSGGNHRDSEAFGVGRHESGRNPGDVWTIPTSPYAAAHFATFPPALARRCIQAGCPSDGTVLDPFAGSGTTLMVARQLARKSVGIELNPSYCDLVVQRIGDEPFDFGEAS